jgi:hypothetical protein
MKTLITFLLVICVKYVVAQYPSACGAINNRNNSNGQPNSCAGVSGTPTASNFSGAYLLIPPGNKTADITFKYTNTNYQTLKPFAITKISYISGSGLIELSSKAGPAAVPSVTGSVDALVKYCVYGTTNLPSNGTLMLELTNPETDEIVGGCMYDASCSSACFSTGGILPLMITDFSLTNSSTGVTLQWRIANQTNTKAIEVECSDDGLFYYKITSPLLNKNGYYSFKDVTMHNSTMVYYRIKVIQKNGDFQYSNILKFNINNTSAVIKSVEFNTTTNLITIKTNLDKTSVINFQLISLTGSTIFNKKIALQAGLSDISFDAPFSAANGVYILKLVCDNDMWIQKIIK